MPVDFLISELLKKTELEKIGVEFIVRFRSPDYLLIVY